MIDRNLNFGRHLVKAFLERAAPSAMIVDVGAGHGFDLELARAVNPQASLVAVETHPPNIAELESRGITVYPVDIERQKLPLGDAIVDVIIANQILEHTKEVFWILHEITRVLKVGGALIIGVPNLASLHNRILLLSGFQPSPIKTRSAHVRGFTKNDILEFLESCFPQGYKLDGFGGSNFYPFPPPLARILARVIPTMAWGIFLMLQKIGTYENQFLQYPRTQNLETNFYLG
jgi:ubiquinone/menaquinone biosynthesis C-methylase UbiE